MKITRIRECCKHFFFLHLLSFTVGYTSKDLVYRWNRARQVAIADDMKLSQFDLIASLAANQTDTIISDTKTGVLRRSNIFICKNWISNKGVKTCKKKIVILNVFPYTLSTPSTSCIHKNIII